MSNYAPPPVSSNFSMQPRGNGPAVASLVCALVGFCVPGVGGLLGIILGIVGLGRAKETASGKGLAIAGIIIGVVTLIGWSGVGYVSYRTYHAVTNLAKAERETTRRYVIDLTKGDIDAAMSETEGLKRQDIADQSKMIRAMGTFGDATTLTFHEDNNICTLFGSASFSKGPKTYTARLTATTNSSNATTWKITSIEFE